jgi:hypothetical protein
MFYIQFQANISISQVMGKYYKETDKVLVEGMVFDHVNLFFKDSPCIHHGQLYVACSRVGSRRNFPESSGRFLVSIFGFTSRPMMHIKRRNSTH